MERGKTMGRKRLLLHVCCAPCSSATLERLTEEYEVDLLFYNPNIAPKEEFYRRAEEEERYIKERYGAEEESYLPKVLVPPYDPSPFEAIAKGREDLPEKGERCYLCYELRLREAARYAMEQGYDFFTTSLSISPYKVTRWINEIGERLAEEVGVPFLHSDFKKQGGYQRSIELSRQYQLYRQDYCGCIYSLKEKESRRKHHEL